MLSQARAVFLTLSPTARAVSLTRSVFNVFLLVSSASAADSRFQRLLASSVREPVGSCDAGSNLSRASRVIAALYRSSSIRSSTRSGRKPRPAAPSSSTRSRRPREFAARVHAGRLAVVDVAYKELDDEVVSGDVDAQDVIDDVGFGAARPSRRTRGG